MKRIFLHIGIHKTGSTSIQNFLGANRIALQKLGIDFYSGAYFPNNHVELHVATMRAERSSPFKLTKGIQVDEVYRESIQEIVSSYVNNTNFPSLIFSAEGLSYLRYEDEMIRLKNMIPEGRIQIVIYLRNPSDFLVSYRKELEKHPAPTDFDKDSFAYTGADSWLIDYEARLILIKKTFGEQNVIVLNYDEELQHAGNIIPSFLRVIGVESQFSESDWGKLFFNKFPKPANSKVNLN